MIASSLADAPADAARLLSKASLRAARLLGLRNAELARVLGVSEATVSRIARRDAALPDNPKTLELAALFIRLYRSLDAIVGGEDRVAAAWLRTENLALGRAPADAIQTITGLIDTVAYLDARRALV